MYDSQERRLSGLCRRSSSVARSSEEMRCGWVRGVGVGTVRGKWLESVVKREGGDVEDEAMMGRGQEELLDSWRRRKVESLNLIPLLHF